MVSRADWYAPKCKHYNGLKSNYNSDLSFLVLDFSVS